MARVDYRNIEKDDARCGGQPVVVGTRVRVATILVCYRDGMRVEEIVQQYPILTPADVHDALAYAYDHLAEIEHGLAADDKSAVKARYGMVDRLPDERTLGRVGQQVPTHGQVTRDQRQRLGSVRLAVSARRYAISP